MARLLFAISLLASLLTFAQPASISLEEKSHTLNERYFLMKSNSQTFQDYKVIKEYVLDGVWKIVTDSVGAQRLAISQAKETASQFEASLKAVEMTLKKERESAEEVVHDSKHISILGIDFKKSLFLTIATAILVFLVLLIIFIVGKMKVMNTVAKEKTVIADLITHEFEEYKRKALEKQTKLARELQNERNKIQELRGS